MLWWLVLPPPPPVFPPPPPEVLPPLREPVSLEPSLVPPSLESDRLMAPMDFWEAESVKLLIDECTAL
ncbi:hypothetical protein TYRP_005042 [Tyrophagus putrescentiae]|nr:hypothetical protein TYRP_005042 [Tyrophagus putrescentiae]